MNLSAQEFVSVVLRSEPRIAVFDCDGTLWAPDTGHGFMDWSFQGGWLAPERQSWLEERYRLYELGQVDEETICGQMVSVYAGLEERMLAAEARHFFEQEVARRVFPVMLRLLCALAEGGTEIWAVSSTSRIVVTAGLEAAGFPIAPERVLAAEVAIAEGKLTDAITAVPTGPGKREALERRGVRPDAAFGNSVHDEAMLRMSRKPYAVNASAALLGVAQREGWALYLPLGFQQDTVGGEEAGIGLGFFESNKL